MTQQAALCPRCRRLIGSDETVCSWCGARRTSQWSPARWSGAMTGDWWIRSIITANIVFYLLSLFVGTDRGITASLFKMLAPQDTSLLLLGATGTIPIDRLGRFWSLLTANYLHGGILHIVFNLMALRQIGPWVSQEYGPSRMFIIYTLGGVAGYLLSYWAGVRLTIGASAAICALIGALLHFGRSHGGAYGTMVFREVSGWAMGLVLFGLFIPGINNWGHGGGLAGGFLLGMLLGYGERRPETRIHFGLALCCAAATAAALAWAGISALIIR